MDGSSLTARMRPRMPLRIGFMAGLLAVTACGTSVTGTANPAAQAPGGQARAAVANPDLDPGSSLGSRPAPDIGLVNQFGQPMSLSRFRGKVVILAFTDSRCTTVCPLTTASMVEARELLGAAGDQVQLLGVNANPKATAVADVMTYSRAHGMVNQWDFLTGSLAKLRAAWKAYHIYAQIQAGQVDHTPALYVIDQRGREQKVYLTTMAYASIGQVAQILAQEAASLLPGHPKLASQRSLAHIGGLGPAAMATLDTVPSGSVTLGPGRPHLVLFFATWLCAAHSATRSPSTPPGGSPTVTAWPTSRGSCSPPPPARSYGSITAGSPSPPSRPPPEGRDLPRRLAGQHAGADAGRPAGPPPRAATAAAGRACVRHGEFPAGRGSKSRMSPPIVRAIGD